MKLVFAPIWSWWLVAVVAGGLLAMVFLVYPQRVRHLPAFYRRLLIGLRLGTVLVLTIAMLRPGIQWRDKDQSSSVFLILMDESRSSNTKDGPGGITRRQAILKTLEETSDQFQELKETVDVRLYDFSESLTPVESPLDKAEGQQTAIGSVLEKLLEENMGNRILGVLLMSDGAQRVIGNTRTNRKIVRYQPVGLVQSKCYVQSQGRLLCSTCHDPHEHATSRTTVEYEQICLQCHSAAPHKIECRVSPKTGCVSCHMPRIEIHPPIAFHDHWIRVRDESDPDGVPESHSSR